MGVLDECHYNLELENGVNHENCVELNSVREPEHVAIEDAVRVLLQGLGEDINREGLLKTPLRVAKALREGTRAMIRLLPLLLQQKQTVTLYVGLPMDHITLTFCVDSWGYNQKVKDIVSGALFPESGLESKAGSAGGAGGLVIVRDLDLFSYCESCLLPFQVKCHVCYVPSCQRVVGLSKLSRVAEVFAKRLQDPSRLANEICAALQHSINPTGVAVVLQCAHIHFPNYQSPLFDPPKTHQGWMKISVFSGSGVFEDKKADIWTDFLSLLRFKGVNVDDIRTRFADNKSWCHSQTVCKMGSSDPEMLGAVSSILSSLGEDPSRKELLETPARFVKWLMNFKNSKLDLKLNGFVRSKRDPDFSSSNDEHMCSELNLPFWSQCEHHLLPFHGVVHIGYYSSSRVNPVGKSLLQSVVHFFGFKLQVQERLTRQIAEIVSSFLGEDTIVVVEASHTCMISRGIEKLGSSTATIAVLGRFSTDPTARAKFLQIIPNTSS